MYQIMVEVVTMQVVDIVAKKRQRMPLVNRNALDEFYQQLDDGQHDENFY